MAKRKLVFSKVEGELTEKDLEKVVKIMTDIDYKDNMFRGFSAPVIYDGKLYATYKTDRTVILPDLENYFEGKMRLNGYRLE